MSRLNRVLESLASGLFVALVAPPLAGAVFGASLALLSANTTQSLETSFSSLLLLSLGLATGAYILGIIPAFLAGLALPLLLSRVPRAWAVVGCGFLGTSAYLLTFGAHLLGPAFTTRSVLTYSLPAFAGTALAAYAFSRRGAEA